MALLIDAGERAPDHGELRPWHFVLLEGQAKDDFGRVLHDSLLARCARAGIEATEGQRNKELTKLGRAPVVLVVGAIRKATDKIPWIEQFVAGAAAAQNILIAATALGYGSIWRTGEPAYDEAVKASLGLGPDDAIVGFLYLGSVPPVAPDQLDP